MQYLTPPNPNTTRPMYVVIDLAGSSIISRILSRRGREKSETRAYDEKAQKVKTKESGYVGITCFTTSSFLQTLYCALKPL